MKKLLFLFILIFSNAVVFKSYPSFNRKLEARRSRSYGDGDLGLNISRTLSRAGRAGALQRNMIETFDVEVLNINEIIHLIYLGNYSAEETLQAVAELENSQNHIEISFNNTLKIIKALYERNLLLNESLATREFYIALIDDMIAISLFANSLLEIAYNYNDTDIVKLLTNEASDFLFNIEVLKLAIIREDMNMILLMLDCLILKGITKMNEMFFLEAHEIVQHLEVSEIVQRVEQLYYIMQQHQFDPFL